MHFDASTDAWRYDDDGALVSEGWRERPCGKCGAHFTEEGHDPCIANLPGVVNACCGHGDETDAYVVFSDGRELRGKDAIKLFSQLGKGA